ncbi:MAG TPA: gluconate 2-dehydrogenase subunit 3 family protein [Pseudomonadales bacterium]
MSKSGPAGGGTVIPQTEFPHLPHAVLDRRRLLAGSAALLPLVNLSCSTTPPSQMPLVFTPAERAVLDAFAERIIPADEAGPGAAASGVARYIERSLAEWNQADIPSLRNGLQKLDAAARAQHGQGFANLPAAQQDELMLAMEDGGLAGFGDAQPVFNRLHRLVLEGMFSDPYYGGNANYAGWDLIGYPGAVLGSTEEMQQMGGRLPMLHTSAYGAEHDGDDDGATHDGH